MQRIVSCPGKILMAGGYAILNPKNHGISIAVNQRFFTKLTPREGSDPKIIIKSPNFDQTWSYQNQQINPPGNIYLQSILLTIEKLQHDHEIPKIDTFTLDIVNQAGFNTYDKKTNSHTKSGLGSSACLITSCLAQFIQNKEQLYYWAQKTNQIAQRNIGSGFDISTAIYGSQLFSQQERISINNLHNYQILLIDLKNGENTVKSVNTVMQYLRQNTSIYQHFLSKSEECVQEFHQSLRDENIQNSKQINEKYRRILQNLGKNAQFEIEPPISTCIINFVSMWSNVAWAITPGAGGQDAIAVLGTKFQNDQLQDLERFLSDLKVPNNVYMLHCEKEGIRFDDNEDHFISAQTKTLSQAQLIIPGKAQLIFDMNQAYSAYSLPKIQYKQQYEDLPQIVKPNQYQEQQQVPTQHKIDLLSCNVNYKEDIKKRTTLNKQLKVHETTNLLQNLRDVSKPPQKKSKNHKTKFRIVKNVKNQAILEETICSYIHQQKNSAPTLKQRVVEEDQNAPVLACQSEFANDLDEYKVQFYEKYGLDQQYLRKKNMVLEEIILLRLLKREKQRQKAKAANS